MRTVVWFLVVLCVLAGCSEAPRTQDPGVPEETNDAPGPGEPAAPAGPDTLGWAWAAGGPDLPFGLAESALASDGAGGLLVGGFAAPLGGANVVVRIPAGGDGDATVELPPYPLSIHHAQATVLDGVPYVFGGYIGGAPNPQAVAGASSAGWPVTAASFHLEDGAWIPVADLPEARAAGGAVAIDGSIYIVGGTTHAGHPASVLRYDMASNSYEEMAALPVPRDHLNVLAHDGLIYAIAGRDIVSAAVDDLPTFEVYDPATDAWTTLPDCPLGRGGQAAAVLQGRIVVAGGERIEGQFTVYDDVHAYDIANGTWVALPPMPEPRHGGALAKVGEALVYLGGATLDGELAAESLALSVV